MSAPSHINYGAAVIGDVGSERGLLSFTVIGDTLNVAGSSGQIGRTAGRWAPVGDVVNDDPGLLEPIAV